MVWSPPLRRDPRRSSADMRYMGRLLALLEHVSPHFAAKGPGS